jgi:Predicted integral membrane protein
MNCENYQVLLSDFVDGVLPAEDCVRLELHLNSCPDCKDARTDLSVIVDFCHEQRGIYDAVPNSQAMWLRISNLIEAEQGSSNHVQAPQPAGWFFRLMHRNFSFPQLAGIVGAVVIVVAMATAFSVYRLSKGDASRIAFTPVLNTTSLDDRYRQQQQLIAYWNERVELNKTRWSQQMRDTFDRNMSVIDAAVHDSMEQLKADPHDAISEDILNEALHDKVALLKEFSDL